MSKALEDAIKEIETYIDDQGKLFNIGVGKTVPIPTHR